MYKYTIMGPPIRWKRPARGSHGRGWDAQKHEKLITSLSIKKQQTHPQLTGMPLQLDLVFYMAMPKTSQKRHAEMVGTWHILNTDNTNMAKFYEDCCVDAEIISDDCLFAYHTIKKIWEYADKARTEFTIIPL